MTSTHYQNTAESKESSENVEAVRTVGDAERDGADSIRETSKKHRNPAYSAQYKFLDERSQLRVWVIKDKFERFKRAAEKNGTSIYRLINGYIDEYLGEGKSEKK